MYSTCIFCNSALGKNESLEHFPVGRRLAFDAAKGRLWVVCPRCERWNLTPIDTRWEAIEEAERAYRGMKLRVSTDNIGLTRLREGTELVRVGAPLLPEFAAWRYGDQFGRRRRRHLAVWGTGAIVGIVAPLAPMIIAVPSIAAAMSVVHMGWIAADLVRTRALETQICATVRDDRGDLVPLTRNNIGSTAVVRSATDDGAWSLAVPYGRMLSTDERFRAMNRRGLSAAYEHRAELTGDAAVRALATLLPQLNAHGGKKRHVRDAVDAIAESPHTERVIRAAMTESDTRMKEFGIKPGESYVNAISPRLRLALEIMLHQDDERRAMEGELLELEMRWRDAEAIASIADSLTLPVDMDERIANLKPKTQ